MTQISALVRLTRQKHADDERGSSHGTRFTTQNQEDLRLAECIERALRATGYGALRAIEVSVNARIVRLVGRVPSYYLKQIAQVAALAVPGLDHIHNDMEVVQAN